MSYRPLAFRRARALTGRILSDSKHRVQRLLLDPDELLLKPEHFAHAIGLSDESHTGLNYISEQSPLCVTPQTIPDITECLRMIRGATILELKDPKFLERELLPSLGLNDENFYEFPLSLSKFSGYGLKI